MPTLDEAIDGYAAALGITPEVARVDVMHVLVVAATRVKQSGTPIGDADALAAIDTPSHTDAGALLEPWLRGEADWRQLKATAVPVADAAQRLGLSASALRRVIGATTGTGVELLGVRDSREAWKVFAYQLPDDDGRGGEPASRDGRRVQRALPPGMHPVAVAAWWDAPNAGLYLDGAEYSPRRWLRDGLDADTLLAAASAQDGA